MKTLGNGSNLGIAVAGMILLLALTSLDAQQERGAKPSGVLATLKVGQSLTLKDAGDRYTLTVIEGDLKLPQSHTVVEVGQEFVIVKDFTGLNETRIPLTSIKAVVFFKGIGK